jgi:hypothetical protein
LYNYKWLSISIDISSLNIAKIKKNVLRRLTNFLLHFKIDYILLSENVDTAENNSATRFPVIYTINRLLHFTLLKCRYPGTLYFWFFILPLFFLFFCDTLQEQWLVNRLHSAKMSIAWNIVFLFVLPFWFFFSVLNKMYCLLTYSHHVYRKKYYTSLNKFLLLFF